MTFFGTRSECLGPGLEGAMLCKQLPFPMQCIFISRVTQITFRAKNKQLNRSLICLMNYATVA